MALPVILAKIGAAAMIAALLRFILLNFCRGVAARIAAKPSLALPSRRRDLPWVSEAFTDQGGSYVF